MLIYKELRILILDHQNTVADLMEYELHKGGILFSSRRVQTKEDFLRELKVFIPNLIISDYKLPYFDGFSSVLEIAREHCPDVPFIFVPCAIRAELAIKIHKGGTRDHVLKEELVRRGPVTSGAFCKDERQPARKKAEEQIQKRVKELEESYDIGVGRESRMIALQEEIERLKEELRNMENMQ